MYCIVCIYIYMNIRIYKYIYIYCIYNIQREREREKQKKKQHPFWTAALSVCWWPHTKVECNWAWNCPSNQSFDYQRGFTNQGLGLVNVCKCPNSTANILAENAGYIESPTNTWTCCYKILRVSNISHALWKHHVTTEVAMIESPPMVPPGQNPHLQKFHSLHFLWCSRCLYLAVF